MSYAPVAGENTRTRLVRRSNKNYDELIRDYIRGARERLEAAKLSPPGSATLQPSPSPSPSPSNAASLTTTKPPHTHSISTAIAHPSSSAHWPLPASAEPDVNKGTFEHHSTTQIFDHGDLLPSPNSSTTPNFNERPAKILAYAAPQLVSQGASNPSLQSSFYRLSKSSPSHSRVPSIPIIREGRTSHVPRSSRDSTSHNLQTPRNKPPEEQQVVEDDDNCAHNPFTDENGRNLAREASIGRSHKPVLTDIVSRSSQEQSGSIGGPPTPRIPCVPVKHIRAGVEVTDTPNVPATVPSNSDRLAFRSGTALLTPTASIISDGTYKTSRVSSPPPSLPPKMPVNISYQPDTTESLQSSAASFRLGTLPTPDHQSSLGERIGSKRPARLNLDAVKEAEKRGSLTSLPDLISRALRLASNLERGKGANRSGNDGLGNSYAEKPSLKARHDSVTGSLIDVGDEKLGEGNKGMGQEHAGLHSHVRRHRSGLPKDPEKPRAQRRRTCCGMPVWCFAMIIVLVFLLVVASILIPIFIVVVPQQSKSTNPCANGGASVSNTAGVQQCICVDGYTGTTCSRFDKSGCTPVNMDGQTNATVGLRIPAILDNAANIYNVNLNASILLPLFSALDMTCASETSLISFTGLSARSLFNHKPQYIQRHMPYPVFKAPSSSITPAPNADNLRARQPQTLTENGIVFAQSTTTTSTTPSTTTSAAATATSTTSPTFNATSDYTLDFAGTAVLFILQNVQQLVEAQSAHSKLYLFLANPSVGNPADLDLGDGWNVNLEMGTISYDPDET